MNDRIFCSWDSGAFVSSDFFDFQKALIEFVKLYGPPSLVEYRPAVVIETAEIS